MSDYRSNFHQIVGSFPIIEFSALIYLTDPQGNLLLIREGADQPWQLPGGVIEPNESVFECLQRTVLAATNVFVEKGSLIQLFSDGEMNYIAENSANITPVYAVFIPTNVHGLLRMNVEAPFEFCFFASWNIPTEAVFPPQLSAIQYYQERFPDGIPLQPFDLDPFSNFN